ncbi:CMD multi-domain protein [Staphylotrichum tortipilum]|uniref:CMD multi-domain protein n=1 Tax=Staphylotrichum tortipilum TaxID=2831512 RepID=A0AAN6MRF4_9PEZI|nr:CMD multi-domain protein [Staphylotrichum longicolle]
MPGLDRKQRSLLNIGMLMALNRAPELAAHIRGARNNGLTELEIRDAILHCTTYCGVPAGVDAMKTAEKVPDEIFQGSWEARRHKKELGYTRERPFPCKRCESRFTRRDLLIRHERLSHGRSQERSQEERELDVQSMSQQTAELPQSGTSVECIWNAGEDERGQSVSIAGSVVPHQPSPDRPGCQSTPRHDADTDEPLDGFTRFLAPGALDSYRLPSPSSPGHPYLTFTLSPFMDTEHEAVDPFAPQTVIGYRHPSSLGASESLSRFCSRLPSPHADNLAPESNFPTDRDSRASHPSIVDISIQDRGFMLRELADFAALGFHEHLLFLHIPSMTVCTSSVELLLAMAAVGSQYCFESEKGVALFHAARAIANERIRRRDAHASMAASSAFPTGTTPTSHFTVNGPLRIPSGQEGSVPSELHHPLMQTAQVLLILMAMATWGKHGELLREALAIQSILASIVREDGLCMGTPQSHDSDDWQALMRYESVLRTKYIVFCFFNLHCIVYNIPPLILSTELQMRLPCSAAEFKADTASSWRGAVRETELPLEFQTSAQRLFLRPALGEVSLSEKDTALLKNALRNWQLGWERSRQSSLGPSGAHGPVAFNSVALLRLAYVRINIDMGPCRALGTRDPLQIAQALREMPMVRRSPDLTPTLLHSAHVISIPIKIGIQLVAKTQTFVRSIQHSLSSLECAMLLSKWFEAVSRSAWSGTDHALNGDERRIMGLVKTMLNETEFAVPDELALDLVKTGKHLNIGMLKVWATIFRGSRTWAIVDVIRSSLELYANMLQATC